MLYAFGFEHIGVVVGDLYFRDPNPSPGQEGAERGVRLEVRVLDRPALKGSIYSAQPIGVDRPIWRADLLETVEGPPGSFDRTHHHPAFNGWEPSRRNFVEALSTDPLGWLGTRLSDLPALLAEAEATDVDAVDSDALRDTVPEILDAVRRLLERVHAGQLATAPAVDAADPIRAGWL
jgi:hypothetical protein